MPYPSVAPEVMLALSGASSSSDRQRQQQLLSQQLQQQQQLQALGGLDLSSTHVLLNLVRSAHATAAAAAAAAATAATKQAPGVKRPPEEYEKVEGGDYEAKKAKRSLPASSSLCRLSPCSRRAQEVAAWRKEDVAEFVRGVDRCEAYGEVQY